MPALSDCLVEELDPATSDLEQLDAIGTVQLSQLRTLLSVPAFAAAAFSIAAAHATAVPALRQLDLGSVSRLCAAAGQGGRLRFVQRLATKVVLRGSKEDVTRASASRQASGVYSGAHHCSRHNQPGNYTQFFGSHAPPPLACTIPSQCHVSGTAVFIATVPPSTT